ncbi:hypothetical protein [Sphaerisporangium sp. TRM90804]|uniref:hypothetical protein n=1 Tax=Sphaerisporangium sp. TRM90804 TaxID=3031113 RepID=UPI002449D8BB|nr:hypothetical protein [Sphaerisporangium sp. TRM90804]MDH2430389.1 hypothetical protein [Sphaerisporangium sp. TRM90804]
MTIRVLAAVGLLLGVPAAACAATGAAAAAVDPGAGEASGGRGDEKLLFRFKDPRIGESSGLAVSLTRKNVIYTHNDSGSSAQFFAVGPTGATLATFTVAGAAARDWEAMATSIDPATGRAVLWFADIGDNLNGAWPDYSIYKVPEPTTMRDATVQATRYRFRYKDGGRNAEGIMVNPRTGRLYVVSKEFAGSVYQAPAKLRTDRVNILRRVGPAPLMATDAAYSPDGSMFVIRTYISASLYRAPDDLVSRVSMPALRQAESIAFTRDGKSLLVGSEGENSPVYAVRLPAAATAGQASASPRREGASPPASRSAAPSVAPSAASAEEEAEATKHDTGVPGGMVALWVGMAVGATGLIAAVARRFS